MIKKVKQLKDLTGMSLTTCKHAILFAEKNIDCTAIGYCKALSLPLNTPNMTFLERVKHFSNLNSDIL